MYCVSGTWFCVISPISRSVHTMLLCITHKWIFCNTHIIIAKTSPVYTEFHHGMALYLSSATNFVMASFSSCAKFSVLTASRSSMDAFISSTFLSTISATSPSISIASADKLFSWLRVKVLSC